MTRTGFWTVLAWLWAPERPAARRETPYEAELPLGMQAAIRRDAERTREMAGLYVLRVWF